MREIFNNLKAENPLVYTLTNIVTAQDVANIMLAAGGSPIMVTDQDEAEDWAKISKALVINKCDGPLNYYYKFYPTK